MAVSNALITPDGIAKEALMMLENSMVMGNLVNRQYRNEFVKNGTTCRIRKPVKFVVSDGATRVPQNVYEDTELFTVATQKHVSWEFTSVQLTMTIEEYSERYIAPAANALANKVDATLCDLYKDVWNEVGTPGTLVNSYASLAAAAQKLDENACPRDNRACVVDPETHWQLAVGLSTQFNPQQQIGGMFTKGYLGTIGGMDLHMDQNIKSHTCGTFAGTIVIADTAIATGDTDIGMDGFGATQAGAIQIGDIFTIADCNAINPVEFNSIGYNRAYVATAVEASVGTAIAAVNLSPTIRYAAGPPMDPRTNADSLPVNGKAVTFRGVSAGTGYSMNLAFHKNAFGLVTMPIEMPAGVWGARRTKNNVSIRIVKQFDIDTDHEVIRMDILFGVKTLYPELACRIASGGTAAP